jgi:hypothetical protein
MKEENPENRFALGTVIDFEANRYKRLGKLQRKEIKKCTDENYNDKNNKSCQLLYTNLVPEIVLT